MLSATVYFNAITRDYPQGLARTAASAAISRETNYYLANIGKVKTIDQFLSDSRLYTYAMKAFGLGDMVNAKGLIRKVLEGGITSSNSLANTLNDPRYRAFAAAFNFVSLGSAATSATAAGQGTVDRYIQNALETDVGNQNVGARMALYFQRVAPTIASAYGILADKTLLGVVQTAFGLPASMSMLNIDVQAQMINGVLKLGDLQSPTQLQKIIERFTANYDAQNANTVSTNPANALLVATPGISPSLLLSLANLKLGGT